MNARARAEQLGGIALAIPLGLIWWGGFALLAPFAGALEEACGAADTRSPNERAGRWTPRPSIYRDGYVHG